MRQHSGKKSIEGDGVGPASLRSAPTTLAEFEALDLETRIRLIQDLVPIGLLMASIELEREVKALAGDRHGRGGGAAEKIDRFGSNPGSVVLCGQRIPISVPRLRDRHGEVPLKSYQLLHRRDDSPKVFQRVLRGISCRDYESLEHPGADGHAKGLSKSTVSSRFVEASSGALKAFQARDLGMLECVAIFVDGKFFAEDEIVIALGIQANGSKAVLGFVQTATENEAVITAFLRSLLDRGLSVENGLLCVIDGAKGLRAGLKSAFGKKAVVQRCQWHKRENVVSYLPKIQQAFMRKRLQRAYERPTYKEAKEALMLIRHELEAANQSAAASLEEGLEETLTLHRLDLFGKLGRSFKTTNCIENLNSQAGYRCDKVSRWTNSEQKQRWLAAALTDIEPKLRKVLGHHHLPALMSALSKETNGGTKIAAST